MDELRKTPERMQVANFDDEVDTSSPLKPLARPVAGHNAEEVAQRTMPTALEGISPEAMWGLLGKTEEEVKGAFPGLPTMEATVKELKRSEQSDQYKRYTVYLNHLSEIVRQQLGWSTTATVINKLTSPIRRPLSSYPVLRPT
jgi:hypothetical protein